MRNVITRFFISIVNVLLNIHYEMSANKRYNKIKTDKTNEKRALPILHRQVPYHKENKL